MAKTKILVRSPRFVVGTGVVNDVIRCDLFIWNTGSIPTNPNYTMSKPIVSGTTTHFDISPFCREFISFDSFTPVTGLGTASANSYCNVTAKVYKNNVLQTTYEHIAFDGYGYFADTYSPNLGVAGLDSGTYYINPSTVCGGVYVFNDGLTTMEARYTGLDGSDSNIITITSGVKYVPYTLSDYVNAGGCILKIYSDTDLLATYKFLEQCEPKYTPINCDFINRHGNWQRLIFFKATKQSFDMKNTEYNLMPASLDYEITQNIVKTFNTNGQDKIKCNTGYVPESYGDVIKQLMLSENIRINDLPVTIDNKSFDIQQHINDKLINYEVSFKYAFNTINDIQ